MRGGETDASELLRFRRRRTDVRSRAGRNESVSGNPRACEAPDRRGLRAGARMGGSSVEKTGGMPRWRDAPGVEGTLREPHRSETFRQGVQDGDDGARRDECVVSLPGKPRTRNGARG